MKNTFTFIKMAIIFSFIAMVLNSSAQVYDWRQMNSYFTVYAKYPGDPNVVFAGDQAGLIRRSPDQGLTWKLVSMEAESSINDIVFLDNNTGYAAVNQSGLILYTQDGGMTWQRKQFADTSNANQPLTSVVKRVVRVDDQTAFFDIFSHSISTVSIRKTIVTRDAGATYSIVHAPGNVYHVDGDTMVAFGREADFFGVAKFAIYRSLDKGQTWSIFKTSPTGFSNNDFSFHGINVAFFHNANVFYITANKTLSGERKIFKTMDGGLTFTPLTSPITQKFEWFYFKNQSEALGIMGNGWTYFTTNGGTSWTRSVKDISVPGLFLGGQKFLAQVRGVSYESNDFGNNWTAHSEAVNPFSSSGAVNLYFLKTLNDTTAFVSLGKGSPNYEGFNLMKTTNQGLTWKSVRDAGNNVLPGAPYHFVSADTFFFTGTGMNGAYGGYLKIKYTTNGGLTHTDIFTGDYQEGVKEIVFIDKKHAVTYSDYGGTNFSSDSGKTWVKTMPVNNIGEIVNMVFPGLDTWYVLTTSASVYKSTDRGLNWTNITGTMNLSTGGLNCNAGVCFLNEQIGYVHGCEGRLFKTMDGGQTWADVRNNIAASVIYNDNLFLAFQNATTGFMADPLAAVTSTDDGGATWNSYPRVQSPAGIVRIHFADENTASMLGTGGNFIKYTGDLDFDTDTVEFVNVATFIFDKERNTTAVKLYPNPAKEILNIETKGSASINVVKILDPMGRIIATEKVLPIQGVFQMPINSLEPGIYFVEVETNQGKMTAKILIQ